MFKNLNAERYNTQREVKKTEYKTKTIKNNKGITLIALVITIIVLLILAGVAIATLLGDNGIITKATTAKEKTQQAGAVERVQMEVQGSYGTDGTIDLEQLNENLKNNITGLTYNEKPLANDNKIETLPATVTLDGLEIEIDANGNVSKKVTLAEAKTTGKVFGDNTPITDPFGNTVVIPAGFKIASDSADNVTGGIVIEDATYEKTKESQFVWIPVGDVYTDVAKTEDKKKTITLDRYTFDDSGKETPQGAQKINSYYTEDTQQTHDSQYDNTIAKNIDAFKTSATNNHGYYIGRYEARKDEKNNLTEVGTDTVYNKVNQSTSATQSQSMYTERKFTSDLMNSYAWDTAIVFEQEFDNRTTSKGKKYSKQNSLNTGSVATKGTNNLEESKQDKICNIWDMASNCWEWTTETYSYSSYPCVYRGGYYDSSSYSASGRDSNGTSVAYAGYSFRPLLYL